LIWRREILGIVLLLGALVGAGRPAAAQEATAPATFGEFLRAQGYDVTDAEIAYLNADEHVQVVYAEALLNVDALARVAPAEQSAEWRQALLGELTRLVEADPNATPPAPPSLARHRELGVTHRAQLQEAARQWLAGVQVDDPEWLQRGAEAFRAAMESLAGWQAELLARFPPPQGAP
jgi:hypothetical protein